MTTVSPNHKAKYFAQMRTGAYQNELAGASTNLFEQVNAIRIGSGNEWILMKYTYGNLGTDKPVFKSEPAVAETTNTSEPVKMPFVAALEKMAEFEIMFGEMKTYKPVDLATLEAAANLEAVKIYYSDVEHFNTVANVEGVVFDQNGTPHVLEEGKIFHAATFDLNQMEQGLSGFTLLAQRPDVAARMEKGVVSDIFNSVVPRALTFDQFIKLHAQIEQMDKFAVQLGALYISLQNTLGGSDKFDKIGGFATDEDRKKIYKAAKSAAVDDLDDAIDRVIPRMHETLDDAERLGIHTDPFRTFTAECELYLWLTKAALKRGEIEKSLMSPSTGSDASTLTASVVNASDKFLSLGGPQEKVDTLKAWVMNRAKPEISPSIPAFLTRYYTQRAKNMELVANRNAKAAEKVASTGDAVRKAIGGGDAPKVA